VECLIKDVMGVADEFIRLCDHGDASVRRISGEMRCFLNASCQQELRERVCPFEREILLHLEGITG